MGGNNPRLSTKMYSEMEKRSRIENLHKLKMSSNISNWVHTKFEENLSKAAQSITNENANYKLGISSDAESDGGYAAKDDESVESRLSRYFNHDTKCVPSTKISDLKN